MTTPPVRLVRHASIISELFTRATSIVLIWEWMTSIPPLEKLLRLAVTRFVTELGESNYLHSSVSFSLSKPNDCSTYSRVKQLISLPSFLGGPNPNTFVVIVTHEYQLSSFSFNPSQNQTFEWKISSLLRVVSTFPVTKVSDTWVQKIFRCVLQCPLYQTSDWMDLHYCIISLYRWFSHSFLLRCAARCHTFPVWIMESPAYQDFLFENHSTG